uniref:Zinc finger, RAN-binding domain containing 3 n=1 Tax=Sinocyclocheilus grahami TaxID=75366 RepID=A0A672Q0G8_SINGR
MIADEMGLGKKIQAISVAYIFKQEWPLLIVVPSSLKYTWIEELEKWIPELDPRDIKLVESKTNTMSIGTGKVTILGYGLLTTDAGPLLEALNKQRFCVILVDESHYLKSRNAARSKILVPIIQNAKRAILLTGTPVLGRPEEVRFPPNLFVICFDLLSHLAQKRLYFIRKVGQFTISLIVLPFMDSLSLSFSQEASASFERWEKLMSSESENQFCGGDESHHTHAGAVKDYMKLMLETEQLKFLVFAHHLSMLQAGTEAVIEVKASYIRIDGSVPSAERIQLVHRFQNDPDTRVAILSIQAAGQGLTFTAASHVVFAELYWNPGHIKQAEHRAHRIGQTTTVHIHYLIAKGTFDNVMWAMLNRKETVTGSALNGKKEYLKAEAWTPSDTMKGDSEDDKDGTSRTGLRLTLYFFLCALAPSTPSSLPEHPSSSSSLTSICISDSDHESEPTQHPTNPACMSKPTGQSGCGRNTFECISRNATKGGIHPTNTLQGWVRKSGRVFHSPILLLEELTQSQRRHSSTSRYLSKEDVAQTSIAVAQTEGGALHIINKDNGGPKRKSTSKPTDHTNREAESSVCVQTNTTAGYLQAVDSAGTPLCLSCQKPSREHHSWAGGFYSPACMEDFQLRSNQDYMRTRVLETKQGVCQHCGLNVHQLYVQVRDAPRTHTRCWTTPGWHNSLSNRLGSFVGASSAYLAIFASIHLSIYLSIC